jgi:hypothetical protein
MKKKDPRESINSLRKRKRQGKRVGRISQVALNRPHVEAWLYMEDEQPSRELGQASFVHELFSDYCLGVGVNPCSLTTFGKIMSEYCMKPDGKRGCINYTLKPTVFDYLLTLWGYGEEVKKAA